jgi:pyrimidine operon attenuation protein / uracil phosphoribosyltransferase
MKLSKKNQILSKELTIKKINRIAHQILERNFEEKEIILAGIDPCGYNLSGILKGKLEEICKIKITLIKVSLDKLAPLQSEIKLDCDIKTIAKKPIILVDDVLNTGRTLAYSFKPFLTSEVKNLQVAVIVDRDHKTFPVHADYVGYSLSTTLQEHIKIELTDKEKIGVYLE